jgi:hypothetical protein
MEMQSPDIGKLAEALAAAQSEMEGAKKDAANPFFKSEYSTLFSVWQACREQLTKNKLAVTQTMESNGQLTVYTTLMHSSGQWIRSALSITPGKAGPQELGSCITYLRRYALAAMVGLSPLDDDAEAAMQEVRKQPTAKPPAKTPESKPKSKTPIETYLDSMAKAKAVLNKITGSDDVYYSALKYFDISHANEMKDMAKGEQLLEQLRTFVKERKKGVSDEKEPAKGDAPGDVGTEFSPAS